MSINQLIFRNFKKNLGNYYLYVFALIFSVALYFSFVTLQFNPEMDPVNGSVRAAAGLKVASYLLLAIIGIFLWYANQLFVKRRSREIGLFQLIGMTRGRILRILSAENLMMYAGALFIGTFIGFAASRLITTVLFRITGVEAIAGMQFSPGALLQTLLVFAGIYTLITMSNAIFISRQSILSLFNVRSSTEDKIKRVSVLEALIGILGIVLIGAGYYVSSILFKGDVIPLTLLFGTMMFILGSVIIGTYFLYKGSVRFIGNLLRKRKKGYLNINEVLSLSSVLFRMKSNAMVLTIITIVSALAIGFLCLTYISYYSAEKDARQLVAGDYGFTGTAYADQFSEKLQQQGIEFKRYERKVLYLNADLSDVADGDSQILFDTSDVTLPVISDATIDELEMNKGEAVLSGLDDSAEELLAIRDSGTLYLYPGSENKVPFTVNKTNSQGYIGSIVTRPNAPTVIVSDTAFKQLESKAEENPQLKESVYSSFIIQNQNQLEEAESLFQELPSGEYPQVSRIESAKNTKLGMGLTMFVVGYLGLAFLVTSGCVLYFKQMDEADGEKPNYTILRKLGFTRGDLLRGIQGKQLFNFGIPLLIGLLHSYFAVQSGWFFFGTELWTPMFIVMGLYTALYSLFGILSVLYYKKIIREAL